MVILRFSDGELSAVSPSLGVESSAGVSHGWLSTVLSVGGSLEISSAETEKGSALNISTTANSIASIVFLVCVM